MFIYTNSHAVDNTIGGKEVYIVGVISNKIQKENYIQYKISDNLVNDYTKKSNLKIGQKVKIEGTAKSFEDLLYEEFDYGRYLKSTGINNLIYLKSYKIIGKDLFYSKIGEIKEYITDKVRYLYKINSGFIESLLIGNKNSLSQDEEELFNKTGTSHIISISGMHVGIITSIITILVNGNGSIYKMSIIFAIIMMYGVLVGSTPSVIRAILFLVLVYISQYIDRKKDGISSLSLIAVLLSLNNPFIIYNISFQLSFLATLSIIYFYGYINRVLKVKILAVTIAANILVLPITYYQFEGIAIFSIISNILIVPFISIIMILAIVSVCLFNINIYLSKLIVEINNIIIDYVYIILENIYTLNYSYIEIENPSIWYVIIYYILIFGYMLIKEEKTIKEQKNELQGYYK